MGFAFQHLSQNRITAFKLLYIVTFELEKAAFLFGLLPSLIPSEN
jgi:hypothetical protein